MKFSITSEEIELAKHQLDGVDFILSRDNSLLNYETGSGKTLTSLEASFRMFNSGELDKVCIICTKSSILSFEEDILYTNYKKKNLVVIKKNEDLEELYNDHKKIFIIQYESLLRLKIIDVIRAFKEFKSGLFIDEVHRVKTAGKFTKAGGDKQSQTAASLVALKKGFKKLVGLTATTITSELEDGYRVISFIQPGVLGGYGWFKENFCKIQEGRRWNKKAKKYRKFPKVIGYKNLDKFLYYTKDVMIRYFPKLDYRFHVLSKSLKPGSKRALKYEEIAALTHEKNSDRYSSVMPRLQRLIDKSPAKKFLLQTLAKRCFNDGFIVYSRTRKGEMIEYITEILEEVGYEVHTITGGTKKDKRKAIKEWAFKNEPAGKALVITDAAAQSMNLNFTHNLCFFEIPMGIGKFLQTKGRIGRMFGKWKFYDFYFLLIKNTIDEYWHMKLLSSKEMLAYTSDDQAIPKGKLNKFDERKLKKERNAKVWRKTRAFEDSTLPSKTVNLRSTKRVNGKTTD